MRGFHPNSVPGSHQQNSSWPPAWDHSISACIFWQWNPKDHLNDFTELTKQLIFTFQGNPEAPILGSKVIETIGKEMDKACTIENIFFWTPEQLSILNAINEDFMVLFAYYGCGKTLLLKERAKYLLNQSGDQDIYFFIGHGSSTLLDALSTALVCLFTCMIVIFGLPISGTRGEFSGIWMELIFAQPRWHLITRYVYIYTNLIVSHLFYHSLTDTMSKDAS